MRVAVDVGIIGLPAVRSRKVFYRGNRKCGKTSHLGSVEHRVASVTFSVSVSSSECVAAAASDCLCVSVVCCGVDRKLLCSVSRRSLHFVQSAVQMSGPAALTRFFVVSFRPSMQVEWYLEFGREQFITYPVRFIIHYSSRHLMLYILCR